MKKASPIFLHSSLGVSSLHFAAAASPCLVMLTSLLKCHQISMYVPTNPLFTCITDIFITSSAVIKLLKCICMQCNLLNREQCSICQYILDYLNSSRHCLLGLLPLQGKQTEEA